MTNSPEKLSRKELEEEVLRLRQREAFFDAAQEIALFGYCEWDYKNDRIKHCTPGYANIFGLSITEVIESQDSWEKVMLQIHPEDRDLYEESYRGRLSQGWHEIEYRIYRKDGEIRHVKEVGLMVSGSENHSAEAIGMLQDITERSSMMNLISDSAAKLKLAAQTAKLGYFRFDEVEDKYMEISEEYAEIFGYTVEDFLERYSTLDADMELVHPDDREAVIKSYELTGRVNFDYRILTKDGEIIHVREIAIDVFDNNGNVIESVGTLQDVTELREAELKAAQANRAKSEFLSQMSHELRTPLNAILGFSQLLEIDPVLAKQHRTSAAEINKAGTHLLGLIEQILDLSRIESGNIDLSVEPIRLDWLIKECVGWIEALAATRQINIIFEAQSLSGIMVSADAIRLKQVFLNLLSNAVKYNCEGGKVTIGCDTRQAGKIGISVTDTGPGISQQQMGDLFKPFDRLGAELSEIEGTGIGLVITRQLVEVMQGELLIESLPGEGSTFTVIFDRVEKGRLVANIAPTEPVVVPTSSTDPIMSATKILVAEDNRVNQQLIETQLNFLGYSADFARNGEEALAKLNRRSYPLLLTDIRMPGMDGYELIAHIRALQSEVSALPVVVLTANAMKSDIERCLQAGASAVLSKPVGLNELQQAINQWMPTRGSTAFNNPPSQSARMTEAAAAIDLSVLSALIGGRVELQRQLLRHYIDALPAAIEDMRQAFEARDYEQLGASAHKLKSSSGSMGAKLLGELCQKLETSCSEVNETEIEISFAQFLQASDPVYEFGEAYFGEAKDLDAAESPPAFEQVVDKSSLRILLVDDDYIIHRLTTLVLNDLGIDSVQSALSGKHALDIIDQDAAIDIIICDLGMPEMDGIEFMRHLSQRNFNGSIAFLSGEELRILKTVERLAIEHNIKSLGVLEKPVSHGKLSRLLKIYSSNSEETTVWPIADFQPEELMLAMTGDQLDVYFQPKINVKTGEIIGAEALVRWLHPEKGIIGPNLFIPMAEENRLIGDLTLIVCRKVMEYAANWRSRGMELAVAINISVDALGDLAWPNELAKQVETAGLRPELITLEITESRLMEHVQVALDILGRLRLKRFNLSIDDFGTGYSSMEQLRSIPFSELKIDRAFVRVASNDASARAILESSVMLAKRLDMTAVAEGVETESDWDLVAELECDQVQGYYVARPMPADELYDWVSKRKSS